MMNGIYKYRCQGITLIEILMVVGLLMLLMSFALPSAGGASTKADMRAASENLQYSIRIARNKARMAESTVTMNLLDEQGGIGQRITFSASEQEGNGMVHPSMPDYQLSKEIKVVSDFPSYEFDSMGIVKSPGQITLVSLVDESVVTQIIVE